VKAAEARVNRADLWKLDLFAASVAPARALDFPQPRHLVLLPTYACQHRCAGCLYRIPEARYRGEWSEGVIHTVAELARTLAPGHVEISGGGEPSCHPAFSRILHALAPHARSLGLITNAQDLTAAHLEAVVETCHHVRVSLDAVDGGLYRAWRGPQADLDRTFANLEALRGRRGQGRLRAVGAKFLVGRGNAAHVDAILRWAAGSGLDYVQLKALRDHPSECEPAELARLDERIEAARSCSGTEIRGSLLAMPSGRGQCWASALHAVIDPRGDVYLCCYYPGRDESLRLGSLVDTPWRELWGQARHRRALETSDASTCAHDCRFKLYATVLDGKSRQDGPAEAPLAGPAG
jgi:radical SAM protein with 4Fe4S-binding SPASM domain